ncbi:hypothetical protein ACFRMQ_20225 [Kitasatospora sp. NPDC056783]|uniref:hypothetical protein n=1 Tax=Kitasatospora sp. NPDC056783 TaxID=3345943 RepID=UPI0036A8BAE0
MTEAFVLPHRIRLSLWQRAFMAATFTVTLLLAVSVTAMAPGASKVFGAAMGVASAVMLHRSLRMALVIDAAGITSRTMEWTHRASWCEILSVELADAGSVGGLSTALAVKTSKGQPHKARRLVLRALAGYSTRGTAARLEKLKTRFEATLADHRAGCATCGRPSDLP